MGAAVTPLEALFAGPIFGVSGNPARALCGGTGLTGRSPILPCSLISLEARMAAVLGDPTVDPHGDPIPRLDGSMADVVEMPLITLAPGELARVQRVSDRDPQRLRYLEELGIRPGVTIQVLEAFPFDGPLRLDVSGVEQMIGRPLAAVVQVAPPRRRSAGQS